MTVTHIWLITVTHIWLQHLHDCNTHMTATPTSLRAAGTLGKYTHTNHMTTAHIWLQHTHDCNTRMTATHICLQHTCHWTRQVRRESYTYKKSHDCNSHICATHIWLQQTYHCNTHMTATHIWMNAAGTSGKQLLTNDGLDSVLQVCMCTYV